MFWNKRLRVDAGRRSVLNITAESRADWEVLNGACISGKILLLPHLAADRALASFGAGIAGLD
jgi:hypothetical protein